MRRAFNERWLSAWIVRHNEPSWEETTMRRTFVAIGLSVLALQAPASADQLLDQARQIFQPIPTTPPALPDNPATPEKVELGKMLYFETRLSQSHVISCNSCHVVGMGGVDALETSIGHRWQHGGRNAPTVLNAVFNTAQFWDGRAKDLKEQAGGPIINPVEMAASKEHAVEQLKAIPGYVDAFKKAFPNSEDPISYVDIENAIAVFEATLITPNAPFDRYLKGEDTALDATQKEGLKLFIDAGCASCHNGINIGGGMYAPFGVVERPGADILPPNDKGRFSVTKTVEDEYVFKVPSLRNITRTAPYFHSGRSWDLNQAVAVMGVSQLGTELKPDEVTSIVAFLGSLTGEQPKVVYPILPESGPTTPRPQP
jgi:cytochrome c peroxidase